MKHGHQRLQVVGGQCHKNCAQKLAGTSGATERPGVARAARQLGPELGDPFGV
jgi:hypothetical protein